MSATKSESQSSIRKTAKPAPSPEPDDPPGEGRPAAIWNEASRRALALRLMEQLDEGVELASQLANDPAICSPDDRVSAILTLSHMTNANANLGRTITQLIQVEQRRRTIIERIEPVWNDSNFKKEEEITTKLMRYMKLLADETFDPALNAAEKAAKDAEAASAAAEKPAEGKPDEPAPVSA